MKSRPELPKGPFLVVGLARSGQAAARLLAERGERVVGCDAGHPESAAGLEALGVEVHLDVDGVELLDGVNAVVKSPGVPREAPVIAAARERGLEVVGELELAWRALSNRFCAVTGTNGKTTTTELIGHLHRAAGLPVAVAGNVGTPLASLAGSVDPEATVVCEASSFQLEDATTFAPECAIFLNFAEDHLDRHGTAADYLAAKLRVFANQDTDDIAVLNADEPALREAEIGGEARRVRFGRVCASGDCDVRLADGAIVRGAESVLAVGELPLLGPHNVENAMAAIVAAGELGVSTEALREGLRSFPGVPHRLERVAERNGVLFVNDSKATNVHAASAALASFEGGVRAILGGSLKGGGFEGLAGPVAERCLSCYLVGDAAEQLERDLAPAGERGVELVRCANLAAAVRAAASVAQPGEVVLLAPACASFDAYRDFTERGEHFRSLVGELG